MAQMWYRLTLCTFIVESEDLDWVEFCFIAPDICISSWSNGLKFRNYSLWDCDYLVTFVEGFEERSESCQSLADFALPGVPLTACL